MDNFRFFIGLIGFFLLVSLFTKAGSVGPSPLSRYEIAQRLLNRILFEIEEEDFDWSEGISPYLSDDVKKFCPKKVVEKGLEAVIEYLESIK